MIAQNDLENHTPNPLTYFPDSLIEGIELPRTFTSPFSHKPHPLTMVAVNALQAHLATLSNPDHNLGITSGKYGPVTGKMFGVLVVKDRQGEIAYLSAFSGKLAGSNHHPEFVPPVFDMLAKDSFFLEGIDIINTINQQVKLMESADDYNTLKQELERSNALSLNEISDLRKLLKANKATRKKLREERKSDMDEDAGSHFEAELVRQSLYDKHQLGVLSNKWELVLKAIRSGMEQSEAGIRALKNERRERSAALQSQLFDHYEFLNIDGDKKSLRSIFSNTASGAPPTAAGECATPKLLQYAFLHGYQPLSIAEFWWGASPASEARQHKQFYPPCAERCKPILEHMLSGSF